MKRWLVIAVCVAALLTAGCTNPQKEGAKGAGRGVKEAGRSVGHAVKDGGKAIGAGTKKAVKGE